MAVCVWVVGTVLRACVANQKLLIHQRDEDSSLILLKLNFFCVYE